MYLSEKKFYYLFLIFIALIISCGNKNIIYSEYVDIKDNIWKQNEIIKFAPNIQDTSKLYNININIRHGSEFLSQNLWMFIKTSSPSGICNIDTLECMLADYKGKWLGEGMGDTWDISIPYKRLIKFPMQGVYNFEIIHGRRLKFYPFVVEIGLEIEEFNTEK